MIEKIGNITFILGDCMDFLQDCPDKAFDLAIVDPPYGINAPNMQMGQHLTRSGNGQYPGESTAVKLKKGRLNSGGGKLKNRNIQNMAIVWDYEKPPAVYFDQIKAASKNQIIWGGNYFPLPPTRCIVCWDKIQPWDNFSQWEMAWTSFDKPAKMFRYSNTGGANSEPKIHPTQKPVKLYQYLLCNFAKPGDKILDTHGGSFSHAIACAEMGFELTIIEKDKDYFTKGLERFKLVTSQLKMFA